MSEYEIVLNLAYPVAWSGVVDAPGSIEVYLNPRARTIRGVGVQYCSPYSLATVPTATLGKLLDYNFASPVYNSSVLCSAGFYDLEAAYDASKLVFDYAFDSVPVPGSATLLATRFMARISVEDTDGLELPGMVQLYAVVLPIQFLTVSSAGSESKWGAGKISFIGHSGGLAILTS
jgi:hypothetical protein